MTGRPIPTRSRSIPAKTIPGLGDHRRSALDTNGSSIASFSDRAGTGANFYLMAVGVNDRAPDETGQQFLWSGTSFSAPTISGAVALMAQAFPNLSGKQIVDILFSSATTSDRLASTAPTGMERSISPGVSAHRHDQHG